MPYILNVSSLKLGDIILVGYNDPNSREIQQRTQSLYSHAMLYWHGSVIHAADIVITENPSRMLFEEDESVCVLRLKPEYWNSMRIEALIDYARTFVGTFYDKRALNAMRDGKNVQPKENRQMCARFVAQCYDYVCLDLVDGDYELCTPQDIYNSKIMIRVEPSLLQATPDDIEFAKSYDVTQLQYKSIKVFLLSLKRKFPEEDIVSLNQLEEFIEHNPVYGDCALKLLEQTEYFDLWRKEKKYCPYNYDPDAFKKMWKDKTVNQALAIVKDGKRIIEEKQRDILAYENKISTIGSIEYYRQMIDLRNNIIETAKEMIAVAEQVLTDYQVVKIKYPWCQ